MAGYSATSLPKKLGLKEGGTIVLVNAPKEFAQELAPLPARAEISTRARSEMGLVLLFVSNRNELAERFGTLAAKLDPAGMLWVAWPKRASGVSTDLTEGIVRAVGLAAGLVDTKICAVNNVWSGLKFVIRLKDRPRH